MGWKDGQLYAPFVVIVIVGRLDPAGVAVGAAVGAVGDDFEQPRSEAASRREMNFTMTFPRWLGFILYRGLNGQPDEFCGVPRSNRGASQRRRRGARMAIRRSCPANRH